VNDWAADRALASLARNQVFSVRGDVEHPTVLLLGTLTNRRGQVVASAYLSAEFPNPANPNFCLITAYGSAVELVASVGLANALSNPGPVADVGALQPLIAASVKRAQAEMRLIFASAEVAVTERVHAWSERATHWVEEADALIQRSSVKERKVGVAEERTLAAGMTPDRQLVRPLLLVVPSGHPVAGAGEAWA